MIYLDYQATTPLDDDVADVVNDAGRRLWANPSSPHMAGMKSQVAIESARRKMARLLSCRPRELFFTRGPRKPTTRVVSVMAANNEIGSIQPIAEIASVTKEAGIPLHSDATQAIGYLLEDLNCFPADLISFSSHKIYGPKGVGALYLSDTFQASNNGVPSLLHGGGQEGGKRPGTENLPAILGFAKALEISRKSLASERNRVHSLKSTFMDLLLARHPDITTNSPENDCLPNCLNIRIPGMDAGDLMAAVPNIAISAGSACNSNDQKPSHVLMAIGLSPDDARSSIRIGFGRTTTTEEASEAALAISASVSRFKAR